LRFGGEESEAGFHYRYADKRVLLRRLLKKVHMQGGVTHPPDGYPGPSEAYSRYAATSARVSGYPSEGWVPADGPF
jgi:hypothetical protein